MKNLHSLRREKIKGWVLTFLFAVISIIYVMPIVLVVINSFKSNSAINL